MVTVTAVYEEGLHCRITHDPSGAVIETDAPKDNMGKGGSFSPTDLVASALGSCMLTIMGIFSMRNGISLAGATVTVTKEMAQEPARKIKRLGVKFEMPKGIESKYREALERAALTCPVHKSIAADIEVPVEFHYSD